MRFSTPGWSLLTFGGGCVVSGILADHKVGQWLICGGFALCLIGTALLLLPFGQRVFGPYPKIKPTLAVYGHAGDGGAVAIAGSGGKVTQNFISQPAPASSAKADEEIAPDMPLRVCVTSVLGTSSWYSGMPGQADRLLDLIGKLSQEAALSRLTVWGRRELGSGFSLVGIQNNLEPIVPEYWSNHLIDELQFLEKEARTRGTIV